MSGSSRSAVTLSWIVVFLWAACADPTYSRVSPDAGQSGTGGERDAGKDAPDASRADADESGGRGGSAAGGTGGLGPTGGATGTSTGGASGAGTGMTGGRPATGGAAQGGGGAGAPGTGGQATGGATGGRATGGLATGGRATGGIATAGAGGSGTGGQASGGLGGQASGGNGTAGQPTGGASTGGVAGPTIVSIDFVGGMAAAAGAGGGIVALPQMDPSETAGYKPAANWNAAGDCMGSFVGLKTSTGQATNARVDWNSPPNGVNPGLWTVGYPDEPGDVRMMNGYLDPSSVTSPATVSVTNLPAAIATKGYDVYVYVWGGIPSAATRVYRYSVGNASVDVTQMGPTPTTFSGYQLVSTSGSGNVIVFKNVTGAAFTITATPVSGTQMRAPVNGLQIVSPAGS